MRTQEVKVHTFLTLALTEGKWSASVLHMNDYKPAYKTTTVWLPRVNHSNTGGSKYI